MRALRVNTPLQSTAALLQLALENRHSFEPVHGYSDGIMLNHEVKSEFSGLKLKHPMIRPLIASAYEILYSRRDEIKQHFNLRKLRWCETRMALNSLGDCDRYAPHRDAALIAGPNIELAFIIYFCSTPKRFSGGQLVLHWRDGDEIIEPDDNTMVVFPGTLIHSINQVHLDSGEFQHRRFGVVGRVLGPPTAIQLASKVARKIVGPLVRLGSLTNFRRHAVPGQRSA